MPIPVPEYSLEAVIARQRERKAALHVGQSYQDIEWLVGEIAKLRNDNERLHTLITDLSRQVAEQIREEE